MAVKTLYSENIAEINRGISAGDNTGNSDTRNYDFYDKLAHLSNKCIISSINVQHHVTRDSGQANIALGAIFAGQRSETQTQKLSSSNPSWNLTQSIPATAFSDFENYKQLHSELNNQNQPRSNVYGVFAMTASSSIIGGRYLDNISFTLSYIPKCNINYYYGDGSLITSQEITEGKITETNVIPTLNYSSRLGYQHIGWSTTLNGNKEYDNGASINADDIDLNFYQVESKLYKINFYSDNTLIISKNQQVVGNSADPSSNPSKNTHQFMGWTTDSTKTTYDSNWHGTSNSANKFWATGTSLPVVADSQVDTNEQPTEDGFIIKYYAVWRERESITFIENVNNIANIVFDFENDSSNLKKYAKTVDANNHIKYYLDAGLSQGFSISLKSTTTRYYIAEVSNTSNPTFITQGSYSANRRQWNSFITAAPATGTTGGNTNINIVYYGNLCIQFDIEQLDKNLNSNFSNIFSSMYSLNRSYASNGTNSTFERVVGDINDLNPTYTETHELIYLNPGDSVTYDFTCLNMEYYINQFWNNEVLIDRLTLRNNYNLYSSDTTYPQLIDQQCKHFKFTYTASINDMSNTIQMNHKLYTICMKPFYCKFSINNQNGGVLDYEINNNFVSLNNNLYYIFNDFSQLLNNNNSNNSLITCFNESFQGDDLGPKRITDITINNNQINFKLNQLTSNFTNITKPSNNSGDYFKLYDSDLISLGNQYYLSKFNGYMIYPQKYMLENYRADPYAINVTWNSNYKAFIIIKLPIAGEDAETLSTDNTAINNVIQYNNNGWDQTIFDNTIISNKEAQSTINFVLSTIDQNYQFKELKRYRYSDNDPTVFTITRKQLESGNDWPNNFEWTENYSNQNIDTLSLNNNSFSDGQVDYYFITYEKIPIFYSDENSDVKQAIQFYWEDNKIIGVYYGNTKIL